MKLFSILSLVLLFPQLAFTMERRNQALARAEQSHGGVKILVIVRDQYEEANSAPQPSPVNQSVQPTAAPSMNAHDARIHRGNEIVKRLKAPCTNAEHLALIAELAQLSNEGIQEIARENAVSATLTRGTTQSCPEIRSQVPDAAREAAPLKDERIRETQNRGNIANGKARKWFFFSLAGFSFTFFSWKYSWLPENATYGCGAASSFCALKTLQWSYRKMQEQKKLDELRK